MTSHFFTPENQSFDETEIPPSPEAAAIDPTVDSEIENRDRDELCWYGLCDKDRSWGQCMVAKLVEERSSHGETKQQLAAMKKERDIFKFCRRVTKGDGAMMMGVMDEHEG